MTVIKDNWLLPIYVPTATNADGQNFHARGSDIADTVDNSRLFVRKAGDEMTGNLVIKGARFYFKNTEGEDFFYIVQQNNDECRVNIPGGKTLKLVGFKDGELKQVLRIESKKKDEGEMDVFLGHLIYPEKSRDAANKQYVDDVANTTKDEIAEDISDVNDRLVELEEEINAIAEAVIRGTWEYNDSSTATAPGEGEYVLFDDSDVVSNDFRDTAKVSLHNTSSDSTVHTWDDIDVEQYLQILNNEDEVYGLFTITGKTVVGDYVELEVTLQQTYIPYEASGLARVKIFTPPVMDGDAYVLRSGDVIDGSLQIGWTSNHKGQLKIMSADSSPNTLFGVKADANDKGGEAFYNGRIEEKNHIITKEYFDENIFGAPGPKGDAATINIGEVKTVEFDQGATVVNSGTENDAIFDFEIPRGDKGEKGDKGAEVEVISGSTPPSDRPEGHLLLTGSHKFYIYY